MCQHQVTYVVHHQDALLQALLHEEFVLTLGDRAACEHQMHVGVALVHLAECFQEQFEVLVSSAFAHIEDVLIGQPFGFSFGQWLGAEPMINHVDLLLGYMQVEHDVALGAFADGYDAGGTLCQLSLVGWRGVVGREVLRVPLVGHVVYGEHELLLAQ